MDSDDHTTSNGIACRRSRRTVLSLGAAGVVSALTGCSSITGQSASGSDSSDGVFTDISFEGQQMVVQLAEDHDAERVNLIGPDGNEYESTSVSKGESQARLQILQIEPSDSFHYPLGESTIVAVQPEETHERRIKLKPSIEISTVRQYTGNEPRDYGNVELILQNRGSSPTWLFDIFYSRVPSTDAKKEGDGTGTPGVYLEKPTKPEQAIIPPGGEQTFVDSHPPFLFDQKSDCDGTRMEAEVNLKLATGETLTKPIQASFTGEPANAESASFNQEYACKSGDVSLGSSSRSNE